MLTKWKRLFFLIILTLFVAKAISSDEFNATTTSYKEIESLDYRLPNSVIPTHYELTLMVSPELSTRGTVKIKAIVQEETNKIVLHYGKLNIKVTSVLLKLKQLAIKTTAYNPITEKYSITLQNVVKENTEIIIVIVYSGEAQHDLKGFYKMNYFNKKGEPKKMAATQFSPIYARHAFPCFDEPAMKAFFKIHIRRPSQYIALSNMPLVGSKRIGSNFEDTFEESVKMSTYLVGFVIGELKSKCKGNIKVWARAELGTQTKYAETVADQILKALTYFFEEPYQISKLDMVALPQMYFHAMENWGLITFRESAVLYDERESSVVVQKSVAEVIAHECTHMWFGNSVTPDWWGYLWLKEGFAEYFVYKTMHAIEPKWRMNEHILLVQQNASLADSLPSSKPLSRNVNSPSEIIGMFDRISYDKGLSIIRMMNLSFGSVTFDSALPLYLQSKRNKTGKPEDLFSSMQLKIDFNLGASVETIMNTWTKQSGYPVLSVTVDKKVVKLSQEPFSIMKLSTNSAMNKKWWIPISWITESKPLKANSFNNRWTNDDEIITVDKKNDDWILFNVDAAGFYRVNYDQVSWYKLIKALNGKSFTKIPVTNRATIVDDLLNLARASLVDYNIALDGLEYLKQETDYLPFKTAFNALDYLTKKMSSQPEFNIYTKYLLRLIKNIHLKVGFNDNTDKDMSNMLLRRELNWMSCNLGHKDCIKKSLVYFDNWKNGINARVHKNLKSVVYTTAIKQGSVDNWHFLWNKYNNTNVVSEQMEIFNALLCTPHSEVLEKHFSSFLFKTNNHKMYDHNLRDVVSSILSCNLLGTEFVIDYIHMHYKEIFKFNGNNSQLISSILLQVSEYLSTQTAIDKFETLIQSHYIDLESIMPSLELQLNFAKHDLKLYLLNSQKIVKWLKSHDEKFMYSENDNYIISE